jgi:hypothetical protein
VDDESRQQWLRVAQPTFVVDDGCGVWEDAACRGSNQQFVVDE